MKKSIVISALILPVVFVVFSSNSNGPASSGNGIRNGGPLSNGTCGSCHGGGPGTTSINFTLVEKASGTPTTGSYKPGVVYTVTLSGNNPSLPFFGFQLSAATATQQQAGSFSNLGTGKHISNQSSYQIVEHSNNLSKVNGSYTVSLDWTAPAAGSGSVTLYGIINAVNDDNSTTGDKVSAPATLSLTEQSGTGIDKIESDDLVKVYPNPASDVLHIAAGDGLQGNYDIRILDVNGRVVYQNNETVRLAKDLIISVKELNKGIYFLKMTGGSKSISRSFSIR